MSDIILVKHAKPRIVADEPPPRWVLSQAGKFQCEGLATRLAPYEPSVMFSSDEPKAARTAEIVASRLRIPVSLRRGLRENDRTSLPFFEDATAYNARMEVFFCHPSELSVGAETANQAHARFVSSVEDLLRPGPMRPVVVVSHGAVISLLVARANDLDPYSFWLRFGFGSFVVLSGPSFAMKEVVHGGCA